MGTPADPHDAVFADEADRLFGLAYRMLGSVADAEDVVQEAWLRWQRSDRSDIDNPAAFLTTVTSRLAIDRLRVQQRRREEYLGPWLPEPLSDTTGSATGRGSDPEQAAVLAESITVGFLAVLERLGPVERAVFLLHDVFDVGYDEIAGMVDRKEPACRQIAKRARDRVRADRVRVAPDAARDQRLLEAFLLAAAADDPVALAEVLHEDVVLVSDGGPTVRAARRPIVGLEAVTRFATSIARNLSSEPTVTFTDLNGQRAVVLQAEGEPTSVFVIDADPSGHKILGIYALRNPDKIRAVGAG